MDRAFRAVAEGCADALRPTQSGTWITDELLDGYLDLHRDGYAHSVEAWEGGQLVGGLYGVSVGAAFFGESMFAVEADASKVAFVTLAAQLCRWGVQLIDCQVPTDHLARFGAENWPRARFLSELRRTRELPTRRGPWSLDVAPSEAVAVLEATRDGLPDEPPEPQSG